MERVWYKFYDEGVPRSINYPKKAMKDYFNEWAGKNPDKPYLIWGENRLSYGQSNSIIRKLATAIMGSGYRKGDRIALMSTNLPEYVLLLQACYKIGACIVPTNPMYTIPELTHQFKDSGCTIVFVEDRFANKVQEIIKNASTAIQKMVVINTPAGSNLEAAPYIVSYNDLLEQGVDKEPEIEVVSGDLAMLQYTGGTTGVSKG